jgi:hypothetical protein
VHAQPAVHFHSLAIAADDDNNRVGHVERKSVTEIKRS